MKKYIIANYDDLPWDESLCDTPEELSEKSGLELEEIWGMINGIAWIRDGWVFISGAWDNDD